MVSLVRTVPDISTHNIVGRSKMIAATLNRWTNVLKRTARSVVQTRSVGPVNLVS